MSKGAVAAFFGAVVVSFALGYFVFPLVPGAPGYAIRQVKYVESSSFARIFDSQNTNNLPIPDMSLIITKGSGSRLHVTFSTSADLWMQTGYSGRLEFNISVVIANVGFRMRAIGCLQPTAVASDFQLYESFVVDYMTESLVSGTYNITAYWISSSGTSGNVGFMDLSDPTFNYTRSLFVEEVVF